MRTKLEKHLSHLDVPVAPLDLKVRCLSTIPLEGVARRSNPRQKSPSLMMCPIVVAGMLMFAVVAGVAFWSTRPSSDGITRPSGSVAFAEVLEAARQVPFFHATGYETIGKAGDELREELWYDASKGRYSQSQRSRRDSEALAPGATPYSRTLVLPDGTVYHRDQQSSTVYVGHNPNNWKAATEPILRVLSGNAAGTKDLSGATFGQILSSTFGEWKGQKTQILVLERRPSASDATSGIGPVQAQLYVNPSTKLVIAFRDFAKSKDGSFKLRREYEFDYGSVGAALFNPESIEQGADVVTLSDTHRPTS